MTTSTRWTTADLAQLGERGVTPEEADRQLDLIAHPPSPLAIDRPCTVGDGIVRIGTEDGGDLLQLHADVADRGRIRTFVPASGAATRMFKDLIAAVGDPSLTTREAVNDAARAKNPDALALREFLAGIDRFAFFAELKAAVERGGVRMSALVREGPFAPIVSALLDDTGLGYANLPKALLAFHDYRDGVRTPLEEHLVEASQLAADGESRARLHFTISPEHRERILMRLEEVRARLEETLGASFEVGFSEQKPSTDTIAGSPEGGPFRTAEGRLLFRPAGHGALIENLGELDADLVFMKNVDNVAHDRFKRDTLTWGRLVIGLAARLERTSIAFVKRLAGGADETSIGDVMKFLAQTFHRVPDAALAAAPAAARAAWAREQLARPIRVAGMVPNTGEPGGGPMWVRDVEGRFSKQIVELSQVDTSDPVQRAAVERSTHFSPVFIALALRDAGDRVYPLGKFVDPRAVMVVRKSAGDRELLALERPGLWNGAMAGWNSVFLEVPLTVFNPVKVVSDLLRKEHQPG